MGTPSNLLHLTPSNLQLTNLTRSSQCPTNKSSPTMATLPTSRPATEHIPATLPPLLAMDHHRVTHRRLPAMEHHPATLHSLLATPLHHQATATIHGVAVTTQPSLPMDPTLRMDSLLTPLHQHHTSSHLLPTLPSHHLHL